MRIIAIALAATLAGSAYAEEQVITLKQAPGVDKVENNCAACHSLAYITDELSCISRCCGLGRRGHQDERTPSGLRSTMPMPGSSRIT